MEEKFTPGLELSKRYYWEVLRPILDADFPGMPHSAALIGDGSEILGFDSPLSTDHDWGPRVMLFLSEADFAERAPSLSRKIRRRLPADFLGFAIEPMSKTKSGRGPEILTIRKYLAGYLGFDVRKEIEPADWFTFPEQKLCGLTQGAVFWDAVDVESVRRRFAYYPRDVWLFLLASGWTRIGQEEHLMGRAGSAGDEIGSALIAARLVRDLMRLCFLMEKRYAPYAKWFGTAFARLAAAAELKPLFGKVLAAEGWIERQQHLGAAYEIVAARHNALGISEPVDVQVRTFFTRPFLVIGGGRFAEAITANISAPAIRRLAGRRLIGGIDQISDNTDILCDAKRRPALRRLYGTRPADPEGKGL